MIRPISRWRRMRLFVPAPPVFSIGVWLVDVYYFFKYWLWR